MSPRVQRAWWTILAGCVLGISLTASSCRALQPPALPDHPNIVLILADDLGYGDPQAYNPSSKVPTPNLDRLAAEGLRFTDAHSPSSVCTPTRYGLLTGRYAWRTTLKSGVLWGYSPALIEPGRMTLASLLKAHGYATAGIGKWHLGLGASERTDYTQPFDPGPLDYGFDTYFGIPASLDMDPYVYIEDDHVVALPSDSVAASEMRRHGGGGFWRAGPRSPGFRHEEVLPLLADKAVAYVEARGRARETPFFLYLPLSAPHTPWLPDAAHAGRSGAGPYGDFAAMVDGTVGQVLDALDRTGLADNTLLFVTSDNGAHWLDTDIARYGHRANQAWRGQKADIHEGGHRVPFLVRWPGVVAPGRTSDETICLTDFLATFAELVGATLPPEAGEDSYSLLPVLQGRPYAALLREATVHHALDGMFALREGPWKLIEGRGSGGFTQPRRLDPSIGEPPGQLYHLGDDPGETQNLYAARPDIVVRLQARLEAYRAQGHSRPQKP